MKTQTKSIKESAIVTIAAIRRPKSGPTQYLFNEKERIFELRSASRSRGKSIAFLEHALDRKLPVRAVLDSRRSVIERIEPLSRTEAVLQFGGTLQHHPLHPVSICAGRLLRARPQDALDHHHEISLLLRKGLQLCQPEQ